MNSNRQNKEGVIQEFISLAGNPNVGKSTVFNALTGMHQHTGNWTGKTVGSAVGLKDLGKRRYVFIDTPGTYSLFSRSKDEEEARNSILFTKTDITVVVCDATCLERNLNLVLQICEAKRNVLVCVNLLDEAKRKNIKLDLKKLSMLLQVPVVGITARSKRGTGNLLREIENTSYQNTKSPISVTYSETIEKAIEIISPSLSKYEEMLPSKWLSLRLIDGDDSLIGQIDNYLNGELTKDTELYKNVIKAKEYLESKGVTKEKLSDEITETLITTAQSIASRVVKQSEKSDSLDRKIDKIVTGKYTAVPLMLLLLGLVFWITIVLANYPSELLSKGFSYLEDYLLRGLIAINTPIWLCNLLTFGVYRTVTWVVSVMLPPMAIFFPLFTLLEDAGYLPRIAFNMDKCFCRCNACGKQALTMCMGFGCNAAGVVGCRIIDSKRERLIAILTNNFVPCNGRFPTLIAIITIFFAPYFLSFGSIISVLVLMLTVIISIFATFLASKWLSKTLLKGEQSSFILELPPYRPPQIGRVIVRSIFDRTIYVLLRAISVAAPAGLILWVLANLKLSGYSVLYHITTFFEPFGKLIGLDGAIITAFLLGFPANEIVVPIILMIYTNGTVLTEYSSISSLGEILIQNGWNITTAICMILLMLFHFPCSTTVLTIKKETGSLKWTLVSVLLPTLIGVILCFVTSCISRLF